MILDLDGTLIDTVPARLKAWHDALAEFGLRVKRHQVASRIGMDGPRLAREVAELAGSPIDARVAASIDARAGELFNRLNVDPRPLPGAQDLLRLLVDGDIPWAIATSSRPQEIAISIGRLALREPPVVVDASHVTAAKPAPDLFIETARQLGAEPAGCWAVGDSISDILAAQSAGMTSIAVTAGSGASSGRLRKARPSVLVDNLDGVSRLLREMLA